MKSSLDGTTARETLSSALPLAKRLGPVLIVAGAAMLLILPLAIRGIPKGGDLLNHFHFALPFYDELRAGNWHPGWLADSNWGYGDTRFRFYPPGLYYLLAGARMLTGNWYYAAICAFAILTFVSGLGAYWYAREFCSPKIAMCAGVLYLIAPYHLNELYQASLLSEYAASAVLPFTFMFVERICRRSKPADIAGLAAAYALLVLTHLPLAVIGSLTLLVYALIRLEKKEWRSTVLRLGLSVVLGLGASVFFWGTMLAELKWIKGSSIAPNPYYDYRLNFVFSRSSLTNLNNWYATLLGLGMIGFLLPGFLMTWRLIRTRERGVKSIIGISFASLLMTTPLSYPLWKVIPKLSEIQFPWRWFAITSLTGSVLLAFSIPHLWPSLRVNLQPRKLAVAFVFVLSLLYTATLVMDNGTSLKRPAFEAMLKDLPGSLSFKDWTPVAAADLLHLQRMSSKVEAGERAVTVTSWGSERRTFHLGPGDATVARVWTYYYPHWQAVAAGHSLPVSSSSDGIIQIEVPRQATDIEVLFKEPPRVRIAAYVSLFTWLAIGLLGLAQAPRWLANRISGHRRTQDSALIKPSLALD